MEIDVRNGASADAEGFHACVTSVARERRYLGFIDAPDPTNFGKHVERLIRENLPFVIATHGNNVVGWCDIVPYVRPGFTHASVLAMGLLAPFRGRGAGSRILTIALDRARAIGLERIELEVYATNTTAIALYRKFGFDLEGTKRRARKLDGVHEDHFVMAKLL